MADSYVCSTAKIKCSCGDKISTLTVLPSRTIWLTGQPQANISDHKSMQNIAPFGKCHTTAYPPTGSATAAAHGKLTPMPCVPNTPFPWMGGKNDVLLKGAPALLKSSTCRCVYGGTITLTYDGQAENTGTNLNIEPLLTHAQLNIQAAEPKPSPEELLDGLQMALDAAGLFPGLGAIPDLLNACISACRGDWANAGLCLFAAIPGIGDAAGAAKLMKNGAKIAQKSKKAQKAMSNVSDIAEARAKKEAKAHQERLIEQGIAEGKVARYEKKQNIVVKKDATTGKTVEVEQYTYTSRTEITRASSNSYEKVTPITPSKNTGSSTSYGAGNGTGNMASGGKRPKPKEEPLFEMKEQTPEDKFYKIEDVQKPKRTEEVKANIKSGKKRSNMGI